MVLAGLATLTNPAAARDRPGTPNEVSVGECRLDLYNKYAVTPRICVKFQNTATEEVTFAVDWMMNGEGQSEKLSRHEVTCWTKDAVLHDCSAAVMIGQRSGNAFTTDRTSPQGLIISKNLAFDTNYCFRFEAIDEDGITSEIWSAWACVHTRPPPPPPPAPTDVRVTLLPAESGAGVPGPGKPPRVLVEWNADDFGVAWYAVQRFNRGWPAPGPFPGKKLNTEHEEIVDLDPQDLAAAPILTGLEYRVCAENVAGESCSPAVSTSTTDYVPNRPGIEELIPPGSDKKNRGLGTPHPRGESDTKNSGTPQPADPPPGIESESNRPIVHP
jgi:hypothetical protein